MEAIELRESKEEKTVAKHGFKATRKSQASN